MPHDPTTAAGTVLVVCTGNICRSPYVERLLAHALRDTAVVVRSAGTGALVGAPVDRSSALRIEAAGADPGGFVARQVQARHVMDADLVLAATRQHLASVVPLHPAALRYSFALRDLPDLLWALGDTEIEAAPGGTRVARVAAAATRARGRVAPRAAEDSGVVDPFRRGPEVFDQMVREVDECLPVLIRAIRGA